MIDLSNENIIHVNNGKVQYLQFKKLLEYKDILNHAYSLGLDVNFRTARNDEIKLSNEEKELAKISYTNLCDSINENYINLVKTNQSHTDNVKVINEKINKDMPDFNLEEYKDIDGLITNKSNLILSTTNADCILLLLFDPVKKVIANVHSGWKGTLQRISIKAIKKMIKEYNSKPEDIICCICPSIRKCHFEVDEDVKNDFENEFKDLDRNLFIEKKSTMNKWNIDTVTINKMLMKNLGLKEENIIDSGICSVCNSNIMHSYRVEKENYGLETALITLKDNIK